MWLLPVLAHISGLAMRIFYRLARAGARVPNTGPVLLVANHPNSLLDPAMVAVAAARPVRFLAKSPLFTDPLVGWLIRGAGAAIPVYRQQDDPTQLSKNEETFRAVHEALARGDAVEIFPEGISHSQPSIAPIKTGAARIALGAAERVGGAFPIVPVGLTFRSKTTFRSRALLLVGEAVAWGDLAGTSAQDGARGAEAVRTLTARIDQALRDVTLNLEQWEDAPMIEAAESIHAAEFGAPKDVATRAGRVRETAGILARLRAADDPRWAPLAGAVRHHASRLERLGLRPVDLQETPRARVAVRWALSRLPLVAGVVAGVSALGSVVFWVPYRLTGSITARAKVLEDTVSTHKVLLGIVTFLVWTALGVTAAWIIGGSRVGVAALVGLPALALLTLELRERWRGALIDVRRFFLLRRRQALIAELRARQRDLAVRLESLRRSTEDQPAVAAPR